MQSNLAAGGSRVSLQIDVYDFLKRAPAISRINFAYRKFKIYPSGYTDDIAKLILDRNILLVQASGSLKKRVAASYHSSVDILNVSTDFLLSNQKDCAYLIHECTHALCDWQGLGAVDVKASEGMAFIAEAIYWIASGNSSPMHAGRIREAAFAAAESVLGGTYAIENALIEDVEARVGAEAHYARKPPAQFNGYGKRSLGDRFLRAISHEANGDPRPPSPGGIRRGSL
jgi:hypothetical protein